MIFPLFLIVSPSTFARILRCIRILLKCHILRSFIYLVILDYGLVYKLGYAMNYVKGSILGLHVKIGAEKLSIKNICRSRKQLLYMKRQPLRYQFLLWPKQKYNFASSWSRWPKHHCLAYILLDSHACMYFILLTYLLANFFFSSF